MSGTHARRGANRATPWRLVAAQPRVTRSALTVLGTLGLLVLLAVLGPFLLW